jgi:hypothetical protein
MLPAVRRLITGSRLLATLRRVYWWRVLAVALCAAFWLALATAVLATPAERLRPPPEFRQRPVIAVIRMADIAEVMRICRDRSNHPRPLSCEYANGILVPFRGQVSDEMLASLIEHEIGHRLGWTHP